MLRGSVLQSVADRLQRDAVVRRLGDVVRDRVGVIRSAIGIVCQPVGDAVRLIADLLRRGGVTCGPCDDARHAHASRCSGSGDAKQKVVYTRREFADT
jgi:hypothetical protein